ncbi:MAG: hypothetical protein ABH952_00915 [Candidatus Omnitrophota bacterium]
MKRNITLYLKDIVESIDKIDQFIGGMSFDDFAEDEKKNRKI